MKAVANILMVAGLLLLLFALVGRFLGHPGFILGIKVISVIIVANTLLMLAVLAKVSEKK